jgi:hypothetical protein
MLTVQNIESELSYAYLHAVASRAGFICECTGRHSDEAGVDALIRVVGRRLHADSTLTRFVVDVQLKATSIQPVTRNGRYSYSLRLKNYNDLRATTAASPQLLVVLYLPEDASEWLSHSEESLVSRRCAYWVSLRAAPESGNETHQTVYIPCANLLSVDNLKALMTRFSRQEKIDYVV